MPNWRAVERKADSEFCKGLLVTHLVVYLRNKYNFTVFDFVSYNGAFSATMMSVGLNGRSVVVNLKECVRNRSQPLLYVLSQHVSTVIPMTRNVGQGGRFLGPCSKEKISDVDWY
jgi:hypothetical protein